MSHNGLSGDAEHGWWCCLTSLPAANLSAACFDRRDPNMAAAAAGGPIYYGVHCRLLCMGMVSESSLPISL
jgi:hypothetical protein